MQRKVYSATEHQISLEEIDPHASLVIRKLKEAGFQAYLVGGGVRDLLLKQKPKDFDVSTSAKPEEIKALFRNAILIGRRFRLAHIRFGKKVIEVATFRAGATEEADLILRDNEWGTEEQDVLRRDFTINGLFYDPESQKVIDYVGGYPDLEKRILRTIGKPDVRFIQDPVRMIRLIKFCARFQFEIHHPTFEALLNCKAEILKSSSARIFEELLRMLESGSSKSFFHLLDEYGLLKALSKPLAIHIKQSFSLLSEIDDEVMKGVQLDRSLLLGALVFPTFEAKILEKSKKQAKPLHLGQIADTAQQVIDLIFTPFFKIPRRIRGVMGFLLSSQFRLTPLQDKSKRTRPPRDPSFSQALELLRLRAKVDSQLLPIYTSWKELDFSSHEKEESLLMRPRRKRKRRRRRTHEGSL